MLKSVLPTSLTLGNAFLGFLSIYLSFQGSLDMAGLSIFYATILDLFDGRLARKLNSPNNFGKELDSFADFLSFGVAPAIMAINLSRDFFTLHQIPFIFLILIGFIYVAAAACRLAIFNNPHNSYFQKVKKNDPTDFIGIPSTFMGGILASTMGFSGFYNGFVGQYFPFDFTLPYWGSLAFLLLSSVLMLVPIPFPKIGRKFFDFKREKVFNIIFISLAFLFFRWLLILMSFLYIILPLIRHYLPHSKRDTDAHSSHKTS